MDMIRRNTDYALRLMTNLAGRYGKEVVSSRSLAEQEEVSYELACKLLQKLGAVKLVESSMGPKGGFSLCKAPSEITLDEVVEAIQGPVSVNGCLLDHDFCSRRQNCPVSAKLGVLQSQIEEFMRSVRLDEFLGHNSELKVRSKNERQ